jgi:hypothetical protein
METTRNESLLVQLVIAIAVIATVASTWNHIQTPLVYGRISSNGTLNYPTERCTSELRNQSSIAHSRSDEFMSPIAVKLLADAHYGTSRIPDGMQKEMELMELRHFIGCLKPGAVIFVDTTSLRKFFKHYYDMIKVDFILVSGDTDRSAPAALDSESMVDKFSSPNSRIIHWFAMNCNSNPDPARFTCLMNGISQWNEQAKHMRDAFDNDLGIVASTKSTTSKKMVEFKAPYQSNEYDAEVNVSSFQNVHNAKREENSNKIYTKRVTKAKENSYASIRNKDNSYSLLVSFNVHSNVKVRKPAWDYFCNNSEMRTLSHCTYKAMPPSSLYHMISSSRFVLSPHGAGLDCYRTYEALYLGAYVVVKKSSLDEMFQNLPVLIVNEWSDVTEQLLNDTYNRFLRTDFDFDKLFTKYWYQRFRSFGYGPYSYRLKSNGQPKSGKKN